VAIATSIRPRGTADMATGTQAVGLGKMERSVSSMAQSRGYTDETAGTAIRNGAAGLAVI